MSNAAAVAEPFKLEAQRHRKNALKAQASGDHALAAREFELAVAPLREAIHRLESIGAPDPDAPGPASEGEREIALQLADCWGMLGGVYRTAGDLHAAREAYDSGARYESSPRFNILNTYNQVNRLVVRVLHRPALLADPAPPVDGLPGGESLPELLARAAAEIDRQLNAKREDKAWALADLMMVRVLGGLEGAEEALAELDTNVSDVFPYQSALKVIRELVDRELPMRDHLVRIGELLRYRLPAHLRGEPVGQPAG
jgi:tetratricopeptide (TPR) repeat protein